MTPEEITARLNGRWFGTSGRCVCPSCNGGARSKNYALAVSMGSTGKPVMYCFKGCTFDEIRSALASNGTHIPTGKADEADIAAARRLEHARNHKAAQQARRTWDESAPVAGTLAEDYLRNRGIKIGLPDCLRFHPDCWHPSAKTAPAMIARIDGGEYFAIHRTYLSGNGVKACLTPPKAMLGRVRGGAVRLTGEAHVEGATIVLAEGIETALSLAQILADRNPEVWAALSTSGMTSINLPKIAGRLTIAPDGDGAGRKAAATLEKRAVKRGWTVSILPAPNGLDFNDVLMKGRRANG